MNIPFTNYVLINSGVGGAASVRERELMGRLITPNAQLSPGTVREFDDAASVGAFFGTSSLEYLRALAYFAYVSPATFSNPRKISFARYSANGNGAGIYGGAHASLTSLQAATAGGFALVFNGTAVNITGVDLSAAASLTAVAAALQTAIRLVAGDNTSNATVTYDATRARFEFQTTFVGDVTVSVNSNAIGVNDLATALGWLPASANYVNGTNPQSAAEAFLASVNVSNNFGSFLFLSSLTIDDVIEVAQANAGFNVSFVYCVGVAAADAEAWSAALIGTPGVALTLRPSALKFDDMVPMQQMAATDYSQRNATSTYMFKSVPGLVATVTSGEDAATYDALRVNYYGRTQTAGQTLEFYQRGLMMGPPTAPRDMAVYANEVWLRDRIGAAIMGLLLSTGRVPANETGKAQILAVVQEGIDAALVNGTISVGKPLSAAQRASVRAISGDNLADVQVQNSGYWVGCRIESYVGPGGVEEWKAIYTLIYSKDDAIRFVQGTHALI